MLGRIIQAAGAGRLQPRTKTLVNRALVVQKLDGNGRFRKVGEALAIAGNILRSNGLEWDETLNAHLFAEKQGTRTLRVSHSNETDPFSPTPITNSVLHFSWTLLEPDRYEVVAYLS